MEPPKRDHKKIIRTNFTFLKEDLNVNSCLDYMFQADALTGEEHEQCRGDVAKLLDILMRRGEAGYRAFLIALDESKQTHVKQQLDQTSKDRGRTDLIYVKKEVIEREYQEKIARLERQISDLENEIKKQNKDIAHISKESAAAIQELKVNHDKKIADLDQQIEQTVSQHEHEIQSVQREKSKIQRDLNYIENNRTALEKQLSTLKKDFQELDEKYAAIAPPTQWTLITTELMKYPQEAFQDDACGVCHKALSEDDNVFLLPCLHKLCIDCKENHQVPSESQCSRCLTSFQPEALKPDPARRSKLFLQSLKSSRSCTYHMYHDKEPPVCYCPECECALCAKCQSIHGQTTVSRQHQIYDFEDLHQVPPQKLLKKESCPDHPHAFLDLYDMTCGKNICLICVQDGHRDHSMETIDKAYSSAKKDLETPIQDLQNKSTEIQRGIQEAHALEDDLNAMVCTLMGHVATTRESLTRLLLSREKQLKDEIVRCSESSALAVAEIRNRLHQMNNSVATTIEFIQMIGEFCSKADLMDLKKLAEDKAQSDLRLQPPRVDRRSAQMKLSKVGLRALQHQIKTFMTLYSVPDESGDDVIPDDVPTTTEFQEEISQLEQAIGALNVDLEKTTRERDSETSKRLIQDRDYKAQILNQNDEHNRDKQDKLSKMEVMEKMLKTLKEKNAYLGNRCHDLEQERTDVIYERKENNEGEHRGKIARLERRISDLENTREEEIEKRNKLIQTKCKQLEQSIVQKMFCVGRHRGEHENCMIECSRNTFSVEHLDKRIGSIDGLKFTNRPSESPDNAQDHIFRKYHGTISSTPIYPAPNRLQDSPAYWEAAVDVELLHELLHSDIIFEMGVVSEGILDAYSLVYRAKSAWCLVLRFCRSHRGLCLQIWNNGTFVTCSSDAIPNRRGDSKTFKFGGVFDVKNGKLSFLDLTKDAKLATFEVWNDSPLFLTFGFPPRCEHSTIHFRLMCPFDLSMPAEKKNAILSALR